jgi:RNA polymerase sigma factor (sigma-70 family)
MALPPAVHFSKFHQGIPVHRCKKRCIPLAAAQAEEQAGSFTRSVARYTSTENLHLLHKAIEELPPRCKQIFQLLYIQGKKTEEVAKEMSISPDTVRAQKARGLNLLRPKLLSFFNDQ